MASITAPGTSQMTYGAPQFAGGFNLDVSNALLQGVVNSNTIGKKTVYDQLTPALVALFGRHAPASQRLIWCDTRSNDQATKQARANFKIMKADHEGIMKFAHSKFISTRMRGALVFNLDVPYGSGDYMLGMERFNWISYPDAQMTLCVKLQEAIRAYDPAKGMVVVIYALSPDQLSAVLWCWTFTTHSRADPLPLKDMRVQIRQIMNDTKRAESYMYSINKDQNDP
ncbi:hypothetical protein RhiJN_16603 [Ceratobasidium sp. AG-Ba]|nr:hypothetical protein RhiJN_16603 [Ceratobasidium sp. AG-Ba]